MFLSSLIRNEKQGSAKWSIHSSTKQFRIEKWLNKVSISKKASGNTFTGKNKDFHVTLPVVKGPSGIKNAPTVIATAVINLKNQNLKESSYPI